MNLPRQVLALLILVRFRAVRALSSRFITCFRLLLRKMPSPDGGRIAFYSILSIVQLIRTYGSAPERARLGVNRVCAGRLRCGFIRLVPIDPVMPHACSEFISQCASLDRGYVGVLRTISRLLCAPRLPQTRGRISRTLRLHLARCHRVVPYTGARRA